MSLDEAKIERALRAMDDKAKRTRIYRRNRKKILDSLPLEVRRAYLVAKAIAKAEGNALKSRGFRC